MSVHYSASAKGFFHSELCDPPADAVEITEQLHRDLLAAQGLGKQIVVGEGGLPVAVDPEPGIPNLDDYRRAIQSHIDATAQQRSYDSGITCASYVGSTNAAWAAEAQAFVAWRDTAWSYAYAELAKVQGGTRPQPSVAEIIAELPTIAWPA